jgi:mycothiol system anti-sigma-R factor
VTGHRCDKAAEKVYRYLDREMVWYRRVSVRWHLRRCPPCHDGFDFEDRLKERIRRGCREEMPAELDERLRAFLREHGAG